MKHFRIEITVMINHGKNVMCSFVQLHPSVIVLTTSDEVDIIQSTPYSEPSVVL